MAQDVRAFAATIPVGTTQGAPLSVPLIFPPRIVLRVEMDVPPGNAGNLHFALSNAGTVVAPYAPNTWFVAEGTTIAFEPTGFIQSGAWGLVGWNTGAFDHTVQVRFFLALPPLPGAAPLAPIPADVLSGSL